MTIHAFYISMDDFKLNLENTTLNLQASNNIILCSGLLNSKLAFLVYIHTGVRDHGKNG